MFDSLPLELQPGEHVMWSGRPYAIGRVCRMALPKAIFGLIFGALVTSWIIMALRGGHNRWDKGRDVSAFESHNVVIALVAGFALFPPAVFALSSPLRIYRRISKTHYALTDRRALIIERGFIGRTSVRESNHANRRTFDQDYRWFVVEAAGGLNCCVSA